MNTTFELRAGALTFLLFCPSLTYQPSFLPCLYTCHLLPAHQRSSPDQRFPDVLPLFPLNNRAKTHRPFCFCCPPFCPSTDFILACLMTPSTACCSLLMPDSPPHLTHSAMTTTGIHAATRVLVRRGLLGWAWRVAGVDSRQRCEQRARRFEMAWFQH